MMMLTGGGVMLRIAVVDDEQEQIDMVSGLADDYFRRRKMAFHIDTFRSGTLLLASKSKFDLIFLDIQMDGIDGIDTAVEIRKNNKKCQLFYITNYTEEMERSFTVHPFAFIVKPIQVDKFYNNLDDYLKYYTESSKPEKHYINCGRPF